MNLVRFYYSKILILLLLKIIKKLKRDKIFIWIKIWRLVLDIIIIIWIKRLKNRQFKFKIKIKIYNENWLRSLEERKN